jgi:hypothetical protein
LHSLHSCTPSGEWCQVVRSSRACCVTVVVGNSNSNSVTLILLRHQQDLSRGSSANRAGLRGALSLQSLCASREAHSTAVASDASAVLSVCLFIRQSTHNSQYSCSCPVQECHHGPCHAVPWRATLSCMSCCAVLCSDPEFKGSWARFHVDLGTADELAFDVLINMLVGFSFEVC